MKNTFLIIIMSFVIVCNSQAQVVYEPLDQSVYSFLQQMYVRGFHTENLEVLPLSRQKIAECLYKIQQKDSLLSLNDRKELDYYSDDFAVELQKFTSNNYSSNTWHLIQYSDSTISFILDPILGADVSKVAFHRYNGAKFSGQIGNVIGFNFHLDDNVETGDQIDRLKKNSPETGINIYQQPDSKTIGYDNVQTTLGVHWSWGDFSIGKDFINWGMGQNGKLILSSKAPSYPFIRLDIRPNDWLRFYYMHGWLQSGVVDSLRTYESRIPSMPRVIYREKYIAAHLVSVSLHKNFNFSFGESIIYSDGTPNLLFLNPLLFYRAVDHYLTLKEIGDGNNSQFFFNADFRTSRMLELYGSLFIDEISLGKIFSDKESRNQLGYTLGLMFNHPSYSDIFVTAEYTRILPWVYSNFTQTQTYESDGYVLGHYIGQNADQIFVKVDYRTTYNSFMSFYFNYVRKGGLADISYQYTLPSLSFLYGSVEKTTKYGIIAKYEPYHDLKIGLQLEYDSNYSEHYRTVLRLSYGFE